VVTDDKKTDPLSGLAQMPGVHAAMKRSMMVTCCPESVDELLMLADAMRVWREHPELHNEFVATRAIDPRRMLTRVAMVVALIKFSGVEKVEFGGAGADYGEPDK